MLGVARDLDHTVPSRLDIQGWTVQHEDCTCVLATEGVLESAMVTALGQCLSGTAGSSTKCKVNGLMSRPRSSGTMRQLEAIATCVCLGTLA